MNKNDLSRRELIEATAAVVAAPLLRVGGVGARLPAGSPARFLTQAESALLDELTELLIPTDDHSPGALEAGGDGTLRHLAHHPAGGGLAGGRRPGWLSTNQSGF